MEVTAVCKRCGKEFTYNHTHGMLRSYCSTHCQRNGFQEVTLKNHPDKMKRWNRIAAIRQNILERYDYKCAICGWQLDTRDVCGKHGRYLRQKGNEIHHIVPVEDGGTDTVDNLILLCPNHHKMANAGILSAETLKGKYWKDDLTDKEKERRRKETASSCAETVSGMIFGE